MCFLKLSNNNFSLDESPFLLVMRGYQIIDVSLTPGDKTTGHIVPIVGIEGGTQVDYDTETKSLFWVEGLKVNEEDESINSVNVRSHYFSNIILFLLIFM